MSDPDIKAPAREPRPLYVKLEAPLRQDQLTPEQSRRLSAKRLNDGIRTTASFVNLTAVGSMVSGGIVPGLVTGTFKVGQFTVLLMSASLLHIIARLINSQIVSED